MWPEIVVSFNTKTLFTRLSRSPKCVVVFYKRLCSLPRSHPDELHPGARGPTDSLLSLALSVPGTVLRGGTVQRCQCFRPFSTAEYETDPSLWVARWNNRSWSLCRVDFCFPDRPSYKIHHPVVPPDLLWLRLTWGQVCAPCVGVDEA